MPSPPDPRLSPSQIRPHTNFLAEEEARRRLTAAHITLKRGQFSEAERAVQEALSESPEDAAAHEMLGDIRQAQGDWAEAIASFKTALQHDPARTTAEAKMARATLRHTEMQRRETFGMAYASVNSGLVQGGEEDRGRRSRLLILSLILPGLGQIVAGSFLKGGILIVGFALGCLLLTASGLQTPLSGGTLLAIGILILDWLYAVIDAARSGNTT